MISLEVSRGTEVDQGSVAVVGVDIGGTNIKVALVDPGSGRLVERQSFKTVAERGPEAVVRDLARSLQELNRQAGAVDSASPGWEWAAPGSSTPGGLVLTSPNCPAGIVFPWAAPGGAAPTPGRRGKRCGLHRLRRVLAWSRPRPRRLPGHRPGTGVGGCLIIGGKAWTGVGGSAGEVGHMTIEPGGERCLCGNRGCLETLASASWLVRRAKEQLRRGSSSRLDLTGALDAETIYRAAMDGTGSPGSSSLRWERASPSPSPT